MAIYLRNKVMMERWGSAIIRIVEIAFSPNETHYSNIHFFSFLI
jgi:hypothetical protein